MSHRREQLAASLKRTLGRLIEEGLNDPRIKGIVSITGVTVSPDDRHATILVSVMPAESEKLTLTGLQSAAGHLRGRVGRALRRRTIPMLHFHADASLKKQAAVLAAIRQANEPDTRHERGPEAAPEHTHTVSETDP